VSHRNRAALKRIWMQGIPTQIGSREVLPGSSYPTALQRASNVDAATWGIISTAALGLAGIVATFFAPTWTERKMERRRERRELRTAQPSVAGEMRLLALDLRAFAEQTASAKTVLEETNSLGAPEWASTKRSQPLRFRPTEWNSVETAYLELELTVAHCRSWTPVRSLSHLNSQRSPMRPGLARCGRYQSGATPAVRSDVSWGRAGGLGNVCRE
jgi:hypothetical protein